MMEKWVNAYREVDQRLEFLEGRIAKSFKSVKLLLIYLRHKHGKKVYVWLEDIKAQSDGDISPQF
jgi:hypothetical protein